MESISEINGIKLLTETDLMILSVGISTSGFAEIKMAEKNPNSHIIATTIDEKGMQLVQKVINEKHLNNQITVKLEDITQQSSYSDNYFDYIYARLVLHYLNNQQLEFALKEIYRILKENGKLFVVVRSENAWEAKLDGTSYDEETGLTKHPDIRTYQTPNVKYCYRRLHSEESITNFLVNAGFDVEYTEVYEEFLSPDFNREKMNDKASELIEVLAVKKLVR